MRSSIQDFQSLVLSKLSEDVHYRVYKLKLWISTESQPVIKSWRLQGFVCRCGRRTYNHRNVTKPRYSYKLIDILLHLLFSPIFTDGNSETLKCIDKSTSSVLTARTSAASCTSSRSCKTGHYARTKCNYWRKYWIFAHFSFLPFHFPFDFIFIFISVLHFIASSKFKIL